MRISLFIMILFSSLVVISAQDLEISGKAKIGTMLEDNTADSVVVRQSDGTLGLRGVSTLAELQILSISNDTIYLTGGGYVKLPVDKVADGDSSSTNELQSISLMIDSLTLSDGGGKFRIDTSNVNEKITGFGIIGDSLYIKEGSMDTMKVSIVRQSSALNKIILNALGNKNESFTSDSTGTVMDKDGHLYSTVKIGSQWWMAENLRTTRYSDGSAIDSANSVTQWTVNSTNGKWCWYEGDSTTYGLPYGKLYNWHAVNDPGGLCPSGWHVPSDDLPSDSEWQTLVNYLGGDSAAGTKMKTTSGWNNGVNGTNTSGFSGLPGGNRKKDGLFYGVGNYGYWWSATEDTSDAWVRYLDYYYGDVYRSDSSKEFGFSVRCLRD
ncbi:MAG: hypothetical protein ACJA01_004309 [Saprospiraceae bacterium]|jgi:uncharacterized protein (TIGR02145 family)